MQYERIPDDATEWDRCDHLLIATRSSWVVNWILLIVKIYVALISNSKAVAAALVDSAVCQAVLTTAETSVKTHDHNYPIGRSRLQALGVLSCAAVMIMASIEVVQYSVLELYNGYFMEKITELQSDWMMMIIMGGLIRSLTTIPHLATAIGVGTFLKLVLYLYCTFANKRLPMSMDSMDALAEDHLNDVMSNSVAVVTAVVATTYKSLWWIDPFGALLISAIIIYRWYDVILDQVKKIVGHTAPSAFIESMNKLAESHDTRIVVDITRAYHYGAAFNVEMEIILPPDMTVRESHDIALALQHRIEGHDNVERAFVHVDYAKRDGLEHKVERNLFRSSSSGSTHKMQGVSSSSCDESGLCLNPSHTAEGVWSA